MIRVTRLNREPIYVNAELIEYVETTPDTVISLTTGEKFMVLESPDEIVAMVLEYGRQLRQSPERRFNLAAVSPIDTPLSRPESAHGEDLREACGSRGLSAGENESIGK